MYPLDILGISIERFTVGGETHYELFFNEEANDQTITRLINEIPPDTVFQFYDEKYPSSSDPGAFVRVKHNNDKFTM